MKHNLTLRNAIKAAITASLVLPQLVFAQDDSGDIEEVVVTGSFIRNSAFTQNSAVDTITQEALIESGAPNISEFMRDLTYTQDTDTVSNVLAPGSQQGTGANFNLRGVGENSTLTLIDGMRLLDTTLTRNIPEIAIERLEVVLDGGSALYGSDAVAGVVNIIPVKQFEGFKVRSYYRTIKDGGTENINNAFLWGHTFDNGLSYVGALEWKKVTPLMYGERDREFKMSSTTAPSGNPGAFVENVGADPGTNWYGNHNGTLDFTNVMTDPSCETFNEGYAQHGEGAFGQPSGHEIPSGACSYEWTQHHPYMSEQQDYNFYQSLSLQATDWLSLGGELRLNYNTRDGRSLPIRSYGTNDRLVSIIRADHPANPYGVDVSPYSWIVFARAFTHKPAHLDDHGSRRNNQRESLNVVKLNANYEIAGSWAGVSTYSKQEYMQMSDIHSISTLEFQKGLAGIGGPNGDEYWNPFGSADPRSPYFEAGVTDNSKELTEMIQYHNESFRNYLRHMEVFETIVSGDVYDIPFGAIQAAVGYQWRNNVDETIPEGHQTSRQGFDYVRAPMNSPIPEYERYESEVHAYFLEIQAPLWETVDAQFAVRHEVFDSFKLKTTTPKVSLRWEALPSLAFRASWGESFLAPSARDARPFVPNQSCGETYVGVDGITGIDLAGGTHCSSGNPTLQPETSVIQNLGFTWEPQGALDGFEISLDYQEIEYADRITSLSYVDTAQLQYSQMLSATRQTNASYDPTPGSATRNAADAWLSTLGIAGATSNKISRYSNGLIEKIYRQPANITSTWIDVYDLNTSYTTEINDLGTFSFNVAATYYDRYEYEGLNGGVKSALGKQNSNSGIVPPLPELKSNVRLSWFRDNQRASISTSHWSSVDFDARIVDYYADIRQTPLTAPKEIKGEYITNVRYAIELDDVWGQNITVSAGVNNLTDKRPQLMGILGGFESRLSNPWGRSYWVSMEWTTE